MNIDDLRDDDPAKQELANIYKLQEFLQRDDIFAILTSIDSNTSINDIKQLSPEKYIQDRLSWIRSNEEYRNGLIRIAKSIWDTAGKKEMIPRCL